MPSGRVKFCERGFGFIKDDATREDAFAHVRNCVDRVTKGDRVSYDVIPAARGPRAENVKLLAVDADEPADADAEER
jgi:cold shock CspA family protein